MKQAGWLSSLPLVGIAVGVAAGGFLTDALPRRVGHLWARRLPGLVGLPSAALAVVGAAVTPSPAICAALLSTAACFAALGVAPAWTLCVEIGGARAGVVSGAMNMCGNLGGAVCSAAVGFYLKAFGSWNAGLYTIAALYFIAAGFWLIVDPEDAKVRRSIA